QSISCIHCDSPDLVKNDHHPNGEEHGHCNSCKKNFRQHSRYKAREQGIEKKIIEMTLNSSDVRYGRSLGISIDTVQPC
ncbi:MAG: hypothetical protein ACK5MK_08730, partial [Dysgonomonas sp.]